MGAPHPIRFYFSFRSPYAWFAVERIEHELAGLSLAWELVPLYPRQDNFPNDPVRVPNKLRYFMTDMLRLAREYELPVMFGSPIDTDWARAHAAFLGAAELGASWAFMREMFRARFSRGQDPAKDDVISDCAVRCGLDGNKILAAAKCAERQAVVSGNFDRGQQQDGIFGVPSFVFNGQLFWGHDRLSSVRLALQEASSVAAAE